MHMDKKLFPVVAIAVIAVGAAAFAQNGNAAPSLGHPLIGAGIAVSTSDATVFQPVSIGITQRNSRDINTTGFKGKMRFGGEKLKITGVAVSGNTTTGSLERNSTVAGSFIIAPTNANRWTGALTLDGQAYNLYIFGHKGFGRMGNEDEDDEMDSGRTGATGNGQGQMRGTNHGRIGKMHERD